MRCNIFIKPVEWCGNDAPLTNYAIQALSIFLVLSVFVVSLLVLFPPAPARAFFLFLLACPSFGLIHHHSSLNICDFIAISPGPCLLFSFFSAPSGFVCTERPPGHDLGLPSTLLLSTVFSLDLNKLAALSRCRLRCLRLQCSQLKSWSCPICFFNHTAYVLPKRRFAPSDSFARQRTRIPDMYATESAFVSLASVRCDAVIGGGSRQPLINAYFISAAPASRRRCRKTESERARESDRGMKRLTGIWCF